MPPFRHAPGVAAFVAALALWAPQAGAIVANGTSLANTIGASRFYAAGYTGSRAVVINVDGGYGWTGHETLAGTAQLLDARPFYQAGGYGNEIGALGSFDSHATMMAHALAGRGATETQRGVAYGSTLWSGAIATSFTIGSTNWQWNRGSAFTYPYAEAMITGRAGRQADVVNSSWGWNESTGNNAFTIALDGITRSSARTAVYSAGNNGTNTSQFWGSPGGYNGIVVGALAAGSTGYSTVASFSSRGAINYADPLGNTVAAARARVDIVAPGQSLSLARYGGATGSNAGGTDSTNGASNLYQSIGGTSTSSAVVAGAAALLNDMAYDRYASNVRSHDGQVIKAVLLNSATKIAGWSNAQVTDGTGVVRTTQALDYNSGAGALNLNAAFDQFSAGTNDLSGTAGGAIQGIGWDYGVVAQNGSNSYSFAQVLTGGTQLNATLNWFVGRSYAGTTFDGFVNSSDDYFNNLALQVFRTDVPGQPRLVAESNAAYINTEHLSFVLPDTGLYQLRVTWMGERYDLTNNASQTYGLAWSSVTAVPEPGTLVMLLAGVAVVGWRASRTVRREPG